MRKVELG